MITPDPPLPAPLVTGRMALVPVGRDLARALLNDRRLAADLANGAIHRDFPDAELAAKLPAFAQRLDDAANPALGRTAPADPAGWGLWLFRYTTERMIVGAASFTGPPNASGEVELGYQIVPAHRRRGLTVEGCAALVAWAFHDSATTAVVADCAETNTASIRTLQKLGFTHERTVRDRFHWRLARPT
ncbi:MAG: GNAT family N-acetyltransferase [Alphaproteobacteria bacterium]